MKKKYSKITSENLVKNFVTVGGNIKDVSKDNLQAVFNTNSKITHVNPGIVLKEIKKTLALVTNTSAKRAQIVILSSTASDPSFTLKKWPIGFISNFKQVNQNQELEFPNLLITTDSSTVKEVKFAEKEANNHKIPSIILHTTEEKPKGLINLLVNVKNPRSVQFLLSLLQRAINVGLVKRILRLNYQSFPRLDSNQ